VSEDPPSPRLLEDAAFRLLVASVVDYAIFMLDPRGKVATWNPGAERIKGYPEAEVLGRSFAMFYPEEDRRAGKPAQHLAAAVRDGRFEDEGWRVRKDGSRFWASTVLAALRDEQGHLLGFAKVTRDLTERRHAEEQRRALAEKAARGLEALSELSLALADTKTVDDVVAVIVDRGRNIVGADVSFLYLLDEAGRTLELVGHRGVTPELLEHVRCLTPTSSPPSFAVVRDRVSLWSETAEEYAARFPDLAAIETHGPRARSFWCAPLSVEGRSIGMFGMGFHAERRFPAEDRSIADTIVKQCAQALARAQRFQREERTRAWIATTLRSIGDAVIATDPSGQVTLMNAVAERLTGWTEAEARDKPLDQVFRIISEQTRLIVESPVAKVLRQGTIAGLANHTLLCSRSGKEIPIDDSAAPIQGGDGALWGVVLVFRDATGEKRTNVRRDFLARVGITLAASLDYRATLSTAAQLAVPELADWCAVDIVEPGAVAPRQLALAHSDPAKVAWAREFGERFPPDPSAPRGVSNVIRTGKSELYPEISPALLDRGDENDERRRMMKQLKLESAMVVPLLGRQRTLGALTFVYAGSGRRYDEDDLAFAEEFARRAALAIENALAIKESEDARAEERRLRREADVANRAKDEFLATVSHELRTPLNAIVGWTLTLRERKPPPEIDRALAIIERNARRQTRLIEDVLDVSRIISGKLSLTPRPTSLAEVIDGAIEAVSSAAAARSVTIDAALDRGLVLTADSDRLLQIVWNLLANAVKFSAKGGSVRLRAHQAGPDLEILVADSGEGIAPEALAHVFEPFRQADASTTRKHGGLGLGLAIVKQLVTAHGGTVAAHSEGLGRGAEFAVHLPIRLAIAPVERPAPPSIAPASIAALAPRLDGLTVLVVDDEEDARTIVERVLEDKGAKVLAAASAMQALELLAASLPDVIVSDIGIPDVDGFTLLRRIRSLPPHQGGRTPAIALTAYARAEDAQRAFAAGFQLHAPKPIEPLQLATLVANLGGRTLE
jgi:PAS domain S-box-containing protein